ncbi:hypothetical protein JTB14_027074 [Gonioctena quinquepunctata]|nr:hypothetical protein JTB14_027074 [Gonioctena quinquepunctata]
MVKPKLEPAMETTPKKTIVSKPGPSCEISNEFQPLANSEVSNVVTDINIEEREVQRRNTKKQGQKEAKRKTIDKNTKEVLYNTETISNMETNQKAGKREENPT